MGVARYLTFEGRTLKIADWAKEKRMKPSLLSHRLSRGITDPELLFAPKGLKLPVPVPERFMSAFPTECYNEPPPPKPFVSLFKPEPPRESAWKGLDPKVPLREIFFSGAA